MENFISCSTIQIDLFSSDSKQPISCTIRSGAANKKSSRLHVFQSVKNISTFLLSSGISANIWISLGTKFPYFFHVGCQKCHSTITWLFRIWTKQINPNCRARNIFHNDFCLSVLLKIQRRFKNEILNSICSFREKLAARAQAAFGRVRKMQRNKQNGY